MCETHGRDVATKMRARKRVLEEARDPAKEPLPWIKQHPDDPDNEDLELMRIFDGATWTKRLDSEQSESMHATVDLSGDQTRSVMSNPQSFLHVTP